MAEAKDMAKDLLRKAEEAVAAKTGEAIAQGFWEGLTQAGVMSGIPALVKLFRKGKPAQPGDEETIQKILGLAKEKRFGEAYQALQVGFPDFSLADEQILLESTLTALRHELITESQVAEFFTELNDMGVRIQTKFRAAHTKQPNPKLRVANLAALINTSSDVRKAIIAGSGLADLSLLEKTTDFVTQLDQSLKDGNIELKQSIQERSTRIKDNFANLRGVASAATTASEPLIVRTSTSLRKAWNILRGRTI